MASQVGGCAKLDWTALQAWASDSSSRSYLSVDEAGAIVRGEKPTGVSGFIERVKSFFGHSTLEKVALQIALIQGDKRLTGEQQKVIDKINEKISDFNNRSVFQHPRRISAFLFDSIVAAEKIEASKKELLKLIQEKLALKDLKGENVEIADRIIAAIPNGLISAVYVRSSLYTFPETKEAKPAKIITFQLRGKLWGGSHSSGHSLFAAAKAIFGSQNKTDLQELAKRDGHLLLYVGENFQDIDIKATGQN